MSVLKNRITAVLAGSALVVGLGATGAVAGSLITSKQIENGTVRSVDVKDESLRVADLRPGARELLSGSAGTDGVDGVDGEDGTDGEDGSQGPQGDPGLANVESDGPYPGASVITQGDNSRSLVTADGQAQTVWVQCAPGKVALGGGFTLAADAGQAAAEAVTVIESAPTQIAEGAEVYHQIAGDPDGSFLPNAWKVVAINDGANDVVVRPHVVCATVAD